MARQTHIPKTALQRVPSSEAFSQLYGSGPEAVIGLPVAAPVAMTAVEGEAAI